jgi:hypothetical protein
MSKQISMTLPDVVIAALEAKGAPMEIDGAGETLKQFVMASALGADIVLRLQPIVEELKKGPRAVTIEARPAPYLPLPDGHAEIQPGALLP